MPQQMITREAGGAAPYAIELGATDDVNPSAIFATFDGSGAGSAFLPCVTYYTQDGLVFARSFPGEAVAAGASADVTYFPGGGVDTAAGIRFDTLPQAGDWLYIDTTGRGPAGAGSVSLNLDGNPWGVQVTSEDDTGAGDSFVSLYVIGDNNGGYSVDVSGTDSGGIAMRVADDGNSGITLQTNGASASPITLRSLAGGGIALSQTGDGFGINIADDSDTGILLRQSGDGGIVLTDFGAGGASVHAAGGSTGGVQLIDAGSGGVQIRANGSNGIQMSTGGSNTIDIVNTGSGASGIRSTSGASVTLLTTGSVILGGGAVDVRLASGQKFLVGTTAPVPHFSVTDLGQLNLNNLPTSAAGLSAGDVYRNGAGANVALMIV